MNREPYIPFKNNGLFVVPRSGKKAGKVIQMASAPADAELTGPYFSPDGKTMVFAKGNTGKKKGTADVNLYISRFRNQSWSEPRMLAISKPDAWDSSPAERPEVRKP